MNRRPGREARPVPRGAAVRARSSGLSGGLGGPPRRQSGRQAAARPRLRRRRCGPWRWSPTSAAATICSGSTPARACCASSSASRIAAPIGLVLGIAIGLIPYARASLAAFRRRRLRWCRRWRSCRSCSSSLGLGEVAKIDAHRPRRRAVTWSATSPSGSARCREEQLIKAQTLGASTWQMALRVVLPQIMPRLIEALRLSLGPALLFLIAAEAIAADRGARLPHLPGPPLSGHGRDPALRRLDHAARLRHGPRCSRLARRRCSPGPMSRAAMSAIAVQRRLESIRRPGRARAHQPRRRQRQLRPDGRRRRLRQDAPSCACSSARRRPTRGGIIVDGEPLPGRARPRPRRSSSSATRCSRTSPCCGNVLLGLEFAGSRVLGRLVGRRAGARDRRRRGADRARSASAASRQVSGLAVGRHAAAPGHRPGADPQARACCCSTSRSARSTPASATTCTS